MKIMKITKKHSLFIVLMACLTPYSVAAELAVTNAFARANVPGSQTTAAYMLTENLSDKKVRIVGVHSDVAEHAELHSHTMAGDTMQMRHLDHIDVPAGETVRFAPNGYHIMLIGLSKRLKEGETITIQLKFEDGSTQDIQADVKDLRKKR